MDDIRTKPQSRAKLSKPHHMCMRVADALSDAGVTAHVRISRRDVPYVVADLEDHQVSICYFGRLRAYRLFTPFQPVEGTPKRQDFKQMGVLIQHIRENPSLNLGDEMSLSPG